MRSSGGFIYSWRKALLHLGFSKPAINKLVATSAEVTPASSCNPSVVAMLDGPSRPGQCIHICNR